MNRNPNNPNTIGIKIGLPNSSNKGFDIKTGEIESYAFAIGEGYTIYKLGNYLENEKVSKGIRNIPKIYIKMNGGLSSFFQAIIEGKSGERALTEAGVSVASGIFADKIIDSKLGNKIMENATKHTLTQTSKLASSGATRLATSKMASNIAVKTGVSPNEWHFKKDR